MCEMCSTELLESNASTLCAECTLMLRNEEPSDERWKPVVGWEGFDEVSDWGRVRRIVKQHKSGGYPGVTLSIPGRRTKRVRVHLLVLEAFRGPRPYRQEALHGNDIAYDNRAVNLRWGRAARTWPIAAGSSPSGSANYRRRVSARSWRREPLHPADAPICLMGRRKPLSDLR